MNEEFEIDYHHARHTPKINNFTCLLFRLMFKSDPQNMARFALGFPDEVEFFRRKMVKEMKELVDAENN